MSAGGVAACMAACNSWGAIAGVRFVLGVVGGFLFRQEAKLHRVSMKDTEAGFAPGVAFYLSSWYKRHEVARRYAIYYTVRCLVHLVLRGDLLKKKQTGYGCVRRILRPPCRSNHGQSRWSSRHCWVALAFAYVHFNLGLTCLSGRSFFFLEQ